MLLPPSFLRWVYAVGQLTAPHWLWGKGSRGRSAGAPVMISFASNFSCSHSPLVAPWRRYLRCQAGHLPSTIASTQPARSSHGHPYSRQGVSFGCCGLVEHPSMTLGHNNKKHATRTQKVCVSPSIDPHPTQNRNACAAGCVGSMPSSTSGRSRSQEGYLGIFAKTLEEHRR